ncbi:MAG: ABC transporter substrate-binding protein [Gammaproteobacteria bacterium]|nr:ABC transporter substrate-binding protein [Gammaproteobacteria bacterium]
MNRAVFSFSAVIRCAATVLLAAGCLGSAQAEIGVEKSVIRIGGVLDLEGRSQGLGRGMTAGIKAALRDVQVRGKRIEYVTLNDSYTPHLTERATRKLLNQGVFLMVGNVGTPTAKVSLPILADEGVPAVGFFTGAGILRPGVGDVVNFRASYVQETAAVIEAALRSGLSPENICAYVQNDAYGMAGVEGVRRALSKYPDIDEVLAGLETLSNIQGENPARNNIGPVGVYTRNTFVSRDGYRSLKNWEQQRGSECRLVIGVGTYNAIARFAGYARAKGEQWIVSAVSFTGADNLRGAVAEYGVKDRVVMTQVVPLLDSDLPIVREARQSLGEQYGYVSLEGYIVGKMLVAILDRVKGDLTRANFLRAAYGSNFELGGLTLDFRQDNQGSDEVFLTYLDGDTYKPLTDEVWQRWVN